MIHGPQPIVTNGLVLALDAANKKSYSGSGTTWTDLSGNGNNGTLTNGPTFSSDNGGSIVFDGIDDYVDIGIKSTLQPQSLSVSLWFKVSSYPVSNAQIVRSRGYGWGIQLNGSLLSSSLYTSTSNQINSSGTVIPLNIYNHCLFTYSNSTFCMYLNGFQIYTTTSPTNTIYYSGGYIAIGRDADSSGSYFNGNVSNAQIYNRALSSTEVLQNYNSQKTRFNLI
jgi:Concanavalin A-like lectin/glucanases superfamily